MDTKSLTLTTSTGMRVRMTPAYLEIASAARGGINEAPQVTAVLDAPEDLVTSTLLYGGAPTMVGLIPVEDRLAGFILIRGRQSIAAITFDLAGPTLQPWMDVAAQCGYLPVGLRGRNRTRIVRASLDNELARRFDVERRRTPLSGSQTSEALSAVLYALDEPECISQLGLRPGQVKEATLSLCMSMSLDPDLRTQPDTGQHVH